jgi:hypothetical protein
MKKLFFSRKAILRAIRAACIALYFASLTPAKAQVLSGDGMGNVTASPGFTASSYALNPTSNPPLAASGTLTIDHGSVISPAGSSSSTIYAIEVESPSTTTNSGVLVSGNSGGAAIGLSIPQLVVSGTLTVENTSSGTIKASANGSALALYVNETGMGSGTGNITITNDAGGTISATSKTGVATGIDVSTSGSGYVKITSSAPITASATYAIISGVTTLGSTAAAIYVNDAGTGNVTVTNNAGGTIMSSSEGAAAYGITVAAVGSDAVTISNADNLIITAGNANSGDGYGINASSVDGELSITNTGSITTSAYVSFIGINASTSGSGYTFIMNSGYISSTASSPYSTVGRGISVNASGSGYVSVVNSGTITVSDNGNGSAAGVYVNDSGTNNVSVQNNASGVISATGEYVPANGIVVTAVGGDRITISNAAAVGSLSGYSTGIGINAASVDGTISIINYGSVFGGSNNSSGFGVKANVTGSGDVYISNTGTITSSGPTGATGVSASSSGSGYILINNSGLVSVITGGTAAGIAVNETGSGYVTVTNSGSSGYIHAIGASASGIYVSSSPSGPAFLVSINSSAPITVSAYGGNANGIAVSATGSGYVSVINSAPIMSSATGTATGIAVNETGTGTVNIMNEMGGTITSTITGSDAYGIVAASSAGTVQITNSAAITIISGGNAQGINASGTSVTVSNYASISAYSNNGYGPSGPVAAILATANSGSITVNNSASLNAYYPTGTMSSSYPVSYGIKAFGPGAITVTNSTGGTIGNSVTTSQSPNYGIVAISTGGPVQVTNSAGITAWSPATAQGINVSGTSVTVSNYASVSAYTSGMSNHGAPVTGIQAAASAGPVLITNSSSLTATSSSSYYNSAYGIQALGQGAVTITNQAGGTISASSPGAGNAIGILAAGTSVTIHNAGTISAYSGTFMPGQFAAAIQAAASSGPVTVTNTGTLTAFAGNSSSAYSSYGIHLTTTGTVTNSGYIKAGTNGIALDLGGTVTNSGSITLTSTGNDFGIEEQGSGDDTVTNNAGGTITATQSFVNVSGLSVSTSGGMAQVTNHAGITVSAYGNATGISATGTATTVNNTGTISTYSSGGSNGGPGGSSMAITAGSSSGPVTVTNSGYLSATRNSNSSYLAYGIYLQNAGSVTNSGNITATDYAIAMPTGSHLTLQGSPVIQGKILGGPENSNTSTSLLTFNLTVPTAELSADETELDGEITLYDDNHGGEMTFYIGALSYDIDDFSYTPGDITDDLQAAATPEPATWISIIAGLTGLAFVRRRMNKPAPEVAAR